MKPKFLRWMVLTPAVVLAVPAQADTVGTVGVSLTLTNACVVNGATSLQSNAGTVGTVRFPDQPGIFTNVDAEVVGAGQSGALSVLCSPGVSPTLTIGPGTNDLSGHRRLTANGAFIPYRFFSDAARTSEVSVGQQMALPVATTSAALVPIYARVSSNGAVFPAGNYVDTVQITVSW